MYRPGPWPITARATCGTLRAGQRGYHGHSYYSGAARGGAPVDEGSWAGQREHECEEESTSDML
jgi:hypothetical protein